MARVLLGRKSEESDIAKALYNRLKRFWCVLISPKQEVRGPDIAKVLFNLFKIEVFEGKLCQPIFHPCFGSRLLFPMVIRQIMLLDPRVLAS